MRRARTYAAALALTTAALAAPGPAAAITNPQMPGLQVALKARGFYSGPVDGIAGPLTAHGVRAFQRHARITVDGIAGPETRKALGRLGRPLFGTRLLLHRGKRGWDVSVLEFFLARRGALRPSAVDGRYTWRTADAVRAFQRRRGMLVDGIAGSQTLRALGVRAPHAHSSGTPSRGRSVKRSLRYWAGHYGLSRSLAFGLAWHESGFQPHVRSRAGAWGVMQVMPATWKYVESYVVGRPIPRTVDGNVHVGLAYLHQLMHEFGFRERLAVAAYYQGASAVRRHGLYPETRAFLGSVMALRRRFA
jgi:peptidoglycan hydrolase-like protein with peptidoglycan-binding domain